MEKGREATARVASIGSRSSQCEGHRAAPARSGTSGGGDARAGALEKRQDGSRDSRRSDAGGLGDPTIREQTNRCTACGLEDLGPPRALGANDHLVGQAMWPRGGAVPARRDGLSTHLVTPDSSALRLMFVEPGGAGSADTGDLTALEGSAAGGSDGADWPGGRLGAAGDRQGGRRRA